ncbi:MAG: hypothetical protein ACREC5_06970, partial [Thermoplasmata archaeon]
MALATRDAGLYADLAAVLRESRVPTVSLLPGDRIPSRVAAVLTSRGEAPLIRHPMVLAFGEEWDRASLMAAVTEALGSSDPTSELVVGIDTGPRPGYAVLSGRSCLVRGALDSPEEVGGLGRRLRFRFPGRPLRFRVGAGDPAARARIVRGLWGLGQPIELVDEKGTSPPGRRRPRDAVAAHRIGALSGRPLTSVPPRRITPG